MADRTVAERDAVGVQLSMLPGRIDAAARALAVTERLVASYGPPRWSRKDPLSMLVTIVLSQRSRDAETTAGYAALKERFADWAMLRDAPIEDVARAIHMVRWPELKAPRLQAIMRRITEERGELRLDFLCDLPLEEAVAWLAGLEGVGPKTIACVLLFSCRKPILPVDTHVHRVSGRLGLIGPKVSAEAAHAQLLAQLPPDSETIYAFHNSLLLHGQRVCVYGRPRCARCVLTDVCAYYRTTLQQ